MKARCYDPDWKFNKHTDLRKTFAKVRRQMAAEEAEKRAAAEAEKPKAPVTEIKRRTR